ncbi:MAG: nucleotide exchange factor GrpE [Oscillospiraceae bacterium]|nr:nucleotide exchange factor GrpE [Oscillospiraceae bacterium]MBR1898293.1 nucleotide exchange factor GrpE [Oscillospiraceae bacterium]
MSEQPEDMPEQPEDMPEQPENASEEDQAEETDGGEEPTITIDYAALIEEKEEMYIRLRAEFENFRKRTAKEKLESYGDATAACVRDLLPVIDNFERAADAPCSDEGYQAGIVMILTQLRSFLEKQGVTEIEALGAAFDPNIHQAIKNAEATEEYPEGTVCEVFQKGYMLKERLIRPAMVAVAG